MTTVDRITSEFTTYFKKKLSRVGKASQRDSSTAASAVTFKQALTVDNTGAPKDRMFPNTPVEVSQMVFSLL